MLAIQLPQAALLAAGLCISLSPTPPPVEAESALQPAIVERATAMPDEILELLPANATGIVAFESIDDFDEFLALNDTDPTGFREGLDQMTFGLFSEGLVDTSRPFAIAMGEPAMEEMPAITFAIPLSDGAGPDDLPVEEMAGAISYQFERQYVGVSISPTYPETGADERLTDALVLQPVGFAIDVEAWMDAFGPIVTFGLSAGLSSAMAELESDDDLDEIGREVAAAMIQTFFDGLGDLLDSATVISSAYIYNGSTLEFFADIELMADSPASDYARDEGVTIEECIHALGLLPTGGFAMGRDLGGDFDLLADLLTEYLDAEIDQLPEEEAVVAVEVIEGFLSLLDCSPTALSMPFYFPGMEGPGAMMLHGADTASMAPRRSSRSCRRTSMVFPANSRLTRLA